MVPKVPEQADQWYAKEAVEASLFQHLRGLFVSANIVARNSIPTLSRLSCGAWFYGEVWLALIDYYCDLGVMVAIYG